MCNFISWIEKDGKNYWINDSRLSKHRDIADQIGHSAIYCYYNIKEGKRRELPYDALPKEILDEYRRGEMYLMQKAANTQLFFNERQECLCLTTHNHEYKSDKLIQAYNTVHKTKNGQRVITINIINDEIERFRIIYKDKLGYYNRSNGPSDIECNRNTCFKYYDAKGKPSRGGIESATKRNRMVIEKYIKDINETFNVMLPTRL